MRPRPVLLLAVLTLAPVPACAGPPTEFTGKVVGISDGDTLTVLRGRTPVKVRLGGVDSPETSQDFGTRARQAAGELAFGQVVRVKPTGTDRYGRTLAKVELPGGRDLGHELVRQGLAWWYRKYAPADRELADLEAGARDARVGLWSAPRPIPPWDWRAGQGLPPELAGKVVGNKSSGLYHKATCPSAGRIADRNRVGFDSAAEAEGQGYRASRDCHR